MATPNLQLPVLDLTPLSHPIPSQESLDHLSDRLYNIFSTTGFAYLTNAPLTLSHQEIFSLTAAFFNLPEIEKAKLAKRCFNSRNSNTYRGYFPPQPGQQDNLKEGFEIGPPGPGLGAPKGRKVELAEANVWPSPQQAGFGEPERERLEALYAELQALSARLLSLVAVALGKPEDFFANYLMDSVSTLRLLHYPPQPRTSPLPERAGSGEGGKKAEVKLCCTPHTDSGILTLLHQDPTGGLEVLSATGQWIPAPYIPGTIVVNIGDLLASVSGGRLVATMHRVRSYPNPGAGDGMGRFSVPFFFEPGEDCVVRSIDGDGEGVVYGEHVRRKMSTWVEFQDEPDNLVEMEADRRVAVAAA